MTVTVLLWPGSSRRPVGAIVATGIGGRVARTRLPAASYATVTCAHWQSASDGTLVGSAIERVYRHLRRTSRADRRRPQSARDVPSSRARTPRGR